MNRKFFGTDGIRGHYGQEPMTSDFFYRLGQAAATHFRKESDPLFIVARDTRTSGPALETAFVSGVESAGGQCQCIGVIPTAAVAINTSNRKASAGIMISASHNPHTDNGIKFFDHSGLKLTDEAEWKIEKLLENSEPPSLPPTPLLSFEAEHSAIKTYHQAIRNTLPQDFNLNGLPLFIDTAHGAAYQTSPELLRSLGAEVKTLNTTPNGININDNCGSQHTKMICAAIKESNHSPTTNTPLSIGLAHDGDADRLIMIDEEGIPLDGDELLAILGVGMLQSGHLSKKTVVATIMSNMGLDSCISDHGGQVIRTQVGDRYVLEAMQEHSLSLGGEQSGHMIFLDHLPTGDGLLSGLQALRFIKESGQPLSELRRILKKFPQKLYNLKVREKRPLNKMPKIQDLITETERHLGKSGRIFLRYSGTENLARLLIEAQNESVIEPIAEKILAPLREEIGA